MQNSQRSLQVALPARQPAEVGVEVTGLVTCSICLNVQGASGWIEAEEAIRELRTWDLGHPVQLRPGLCDGCRDEIEARRGTSRYLLADAA
jgi:hypothetical protein